MVKLKGKSVLTQRDIIETLKQKNEGRSIAAYRKSILIKDVKERLNKIIIGQTDAVEKSVDAFITSCSAVGGCMLFSGPTGSGKTTLAKELSKIVFKNDSLLKIDMSEFSEKHTVSRLIGAPPGYVGYDNSGMLVDEIIKNPSRIVLFDEIDKAHPDVLKILLGLLDDGVLRDSRGELVSFKNTVIIFTSSIGFENMQRESGFLKNEKNSAGEALRRALGNELFARIEDVIAFKKPTVADAKEACEQYIKSVNDGYGIFLSVEDRVIDLIVKKCDVNNLGLRNVKKEFSRTVERRIKERLLDMKSKAPIKVFLDENQNVCLNEYFDKVNLEKAELSMYNTI